MRGITARVLSSAGRSSTRPASQNMTPPSNRSQGGRGLVHFSANRRNLQVQLDPKTWTCPPLPRPVNGYRLASSLFRPRRFTFVSGEVFALGGEVPPLTPWAEPALPEHPLRIPEERRVKLLPILRSGAIVQVAGQPRGADTPGFTARSIGKMGSRWPRLAYRPSLHKS